MEPHSYECGNSAAFRCVADRYFRLQWSRTLTSAEIRRTSRRIRSPRRASMEPHSYECGNAGPLICPQWTRGRFNGAALLRVRKYLGMRGALSK